jgi:tripartite-type tricarboxylate transporter receptor subunit TctC
MRKILVLFSLFLFVLVFRTAVLAQDEFPSKPIKIIIPLSPGSVNDVVTRLLAPNLEKALKTQIQVEYKAGGGGGVVGADFLAKSNPDGYNLGCLHNSVITIAPILNPVPYDPLKDFTPIAKLGFGIHLLVVNESSPWKTLEEFLDYAKKNPGKATCGTTGTGTFGHLNVEILSKEAGVQITHIPYKGGSGPNIAALLGGHIDSAHQMWPAVVNHVRAGKLRPLASTAPIKEYPQVPTYSQRGFPSVNLTVWFFFSGPANLSKGVQDRLERAFEMAINEPENIAKLEKLGWTVKHAGTTEVLKQLKEEFAVVQDLVTKLGLKKN